MLWLCTYKTQKPYRKPLKYPCEFLSEKFPNIAQPKPINVMLFPRIFQQPQKMCLTTVKHSTNCWFITSIQKAERQPEVAMILGQRRPEFKSTPLQESFHACCWSFCLHHLLLSSKRGRRICYWVVDTLTFFL